ncbi:MAG: HD domain-containing protein [Desulfobacteraceae bacterium]|nr:HD domain-containing protein [Desulfobacteraceae bacterium]
MSDYIALRRSQITHCYSIPFFCLSENGNGVLYKNAGEKLAESKYAEAKKLKLFIHKDDRSAATKELQRALNLELAKSIATEGVSKVRKVLRDIIEEALTASFNDSYEAMPETIEIMFYGYSKNSQLLEALIKISSNSSISIEHTINVLALTMIYCFGNDVPINATKRLGVAAILHDIGCTMINKKILDTEYKLSENDFQVFKTHPIKGHDIIKSSTRFDKIISSVALEHHERLDGSGYPQGITDISFESQLIGLIDCYEPLTYRDKVFRKAQAPFGSLKLLKEEVVAKKFDKDIFKNFCGCLASRNY